MKSIQIPYKYNLNRIEKCLLLSDVNNGIVLCRKLGFNPNKIIVGEKEWAEMQNWTYGGASDLFKDRKNILQKALNIEFIKGNKRNELTFSCNRLFKF